MHLWMYHGYAAAACAWTFMETSLMLERVKDNPKHWLARSIRKIRDVTEKRNKFVCVLLKSLAVPLLALVSWIPCLLAAALWPVAVTLYIISNITWKPKHGSKK